MLRTVNDLELDGRALAWNEELLRKDEKVDALIKTVPLTCH